MITKTTIRKAFYRRMLTFHTDKTHASKGTRECGICDITCRLVLVCHEHFLEIYPDAVQQSDYSATTATDAATDPTATDPTGTATDPTATISDPTATTSDPTATPTDPTAAATDPTATGTDPTATGTDPTATTSDPTAAATDPTATPTDPTATPTDPTGTATDPTATPTDPTATAAATDPTATPTDPTATAIDVSRPSDGDGDTHPGDDDVPEDTSSLYVGLRNPGARCWLNAFLQIMRFIQVLLV